MMMTTTTKIMGNEVYYFSIYFRFSSWPVKGPTWTDKRVDGERCYFQCFFCFITYRHGWSSNW